jgi:hypothetical protein
MDSQVYRQVNALSIHVLTDSGHICANIGPEQLRFTPKLTSKSAADQFTLADFRRSSTEGATISSSTAWGFSAALTASRPCRCSSPVSAS